jgi:transposase InsO family protein
VEKTCGRIGMTRQNYYKRREERAGRSLGDEMLCKHVIDIRADHPRMGGRKLLLLISKDLAMHGLKIGRDKLFRVLRDNGLLVEPYKAKTPKTTRYDASLPCFGNVIKEIDIVRSNQVWVADITYLMMANGFCYLSLIMDLFSRKIVGFHVSESLAAEGCMQALKDAIGMTRAQDVIHHSDRGCQYASHAYVGALRKAGFSISMTEERHCYENSAAERLNGILKQEYGLDGKFSCIEEVIRRVLKVIELYNNERPHTSLGMKTPAEVHQAA